MARAYFYLAVPTSLLVVLALELATSQARVTLMAAPLPAARIVSPAASGLRAEVDVLLARPLFSPRRRPVIAAPPPVPQPPRLSGIVVTGSGRYAIFVSAGGHPMIAARGQFVGPFRIREITTTQVIVSGPNGSLTLHTSDAETAWGGASQAGSKPPNIPAPIVLPGGITLYPATGDNLPDAADWPGTRD